MRKEKNNIGKIIIFIIVLILVGLFLCFIIWPEKEDTKKASYSDIKANEIEIFNLASNDTTNFQTVRVLRPDKNIPGINHNFLFVLPVEKNGVVEDFGDGMEVMRKLNVHNNYNLTIIKPSFDIPPWYANHPTDKKYQYESFLVSELVPWAKDNFEVSGREQNWLIGYSKSGYGAIDLIFKHPDVFKLAAA